MSKFYIPSKGPDSWKDFLAEPEKQWKTGYSAKSLACCWEEAEGFPNSVISVFNNSEYELFHSIEFLLGIPEHQVPLPGGSTASQNDIYVLAKSSDELISIAVEGKVSEPFGDLVSIWGKEMTSGKEKRLNYLLDKLGLSGLDVSHVRYQLLHRTASALIEADRFCASHALMLVHTFSQSHEWFDDYSAFAALYDIEAKLNAIHYAGEISGKNLYLAWVTGEAEYLER